MKVKMGTNISNVRNATTLFLLPLLFNRPGIINQHFVNAYIENDEFPGGKSIALVYRQPNEELQKYSPFAVISRGKNVIYFFRHELSVIMTDFLRGNYSSFTPTCKHRIIRFWNLNSRSVVYKMMYPPISVLGMEDTTPDWPKPNMNYETLNLRST